VQLLRHDRTETQSREDDGRVGKLLNRKIDFSFTLLANVRAGFFVFRGRGTPEVLKDRQRNYPAARVNLKVFVLFGFAVKSSKRVELGALPTPGYECKSR
jgi:hypothetical protein